MISDNNGCHDDPFFKTCFHKKVGVLLKTRMPWSLCLCTRFLSVTFEVQLQGLVASQVKRGIRSAIALPGWPGSELVIAAKSLNSTAKITSQQVTRLKIIV